MAKTTGGQRSKFCDALACTVVKSAREISEILPRGLGTGEQRSKCHETRKDMGDYNINVV